MLVSVPQAIGATCSGIMRNIHTEHLKESAYSHSNNERAITPWFKVIFSKEYFIFPKNPNDKQEFRKKKPPLHPLHVCNAEKRE